MAAPQYARRVCAARASLAIPVAAALRAPASARCRGAHRVRDAGNARAMVLRPHHRTWPARVDVIGPLHGDFLGAVQPRVYRLDTLREAVILVRHLILPCAEPATAVHVPRSKHVLNSIEAAVPIRRRHGVPMLETRVPGVVHLPIR